jgi:hypothetical protein
MLKIPYKYGNRYFKISPYTTRQEKHLLLLASLEYDKLDNALEILNVNQEDIKIMSENEKIAMLYKIREISVGDILNTKITCAHCGSIYDKDISILDIIEEPQEKNVHVIDAYKELTDENINDFLDFDIDSLNVSDYDKWYEIVQNSIVKFKFDRETHCDHCKKINIFNMNDVNFAIDAMSEDSLVSLYQTISDLVYFSNYSKEDIENMYPYERSILINLLQQTRDKVANNAI